MNAAQILVVVGTRPEAVKTAPLVRALQQHSRARVRVVVTAQHRHLVEPVLRFFGVGVDRDLDLMVQDQSPHELVARMLAALDPVLVQEQPDWVVAQGDTATVFATALACFYRKVPFAHVEAGLRTHDRSQPFPEEGHRAMVARLADVHFAPTAAARDNLLRENLAPSQIHVVGNTVVDALHHACERVDPRSWSPAGGERLVLVTAHRRENFGEPLAAICRAVARLADRKDVSIVFPVHPNPNVQDVVHRLLGPHPRVRLVAPLDYPDMVAAMRACHFVMTDSGGVQEEAPALGKPVLVLRAVTERHEGVAAGAARLVGCDEARILEEAVRLLDDDAAYRSMAVVRTPYGDGASCARIVNVLLRSPAGRA